MQYWQVWYPKAAATGMLLARGLLEPTEVLLLHAAPDPITVEVFDEQGYRLAYGKDLERTEPSPICRLRLEGNSVVREDCWPTERDIGSVIMLPGGEVGVLKSWWHANDKKEWRWQVEFYNSIR
jgi:hypothetical protein